MFAGTISEMLKRCIVKGCRTDQVDRFQFPVEYPDLNTAWIKSLEKHQVLPHDYESYFVCPLHFVGSDFLKFNDQLQLKTEAVPSLYPNFPFQHNVPTNRFVYKEGVSDIEDLSCEFLDSDDSSEYRIFINRDNLTYVVHNNEIQNNSSSLELLLETNPMGSAVEYSSGNERIIDNSLQCLRWKLLKKDEELKECQETLQSMLEIVNKQNETISVLEAELQNLKTEEGIETNSSGKKDRLLREELLESKELEGTEMQIFCTSLFYFSPSVYAYMRSIIPSMPTEQKIADWVKNGIAANIFPKGMVNIEKFNFNGI